MFTEKAFKNTDNFPVTAGGKKHTENKDRWKLKPDKTVYGPLLVKADNNCSKLPWGKTRLFIS